MGRALFDAVLNAQPRALREKASRKHAPAPRLDVEMTAADEESAVEPASTGEVSVPHASTQPEQRERSRDRRQRRLENLAERTCL